MRVKKSAHAIYRTQYHILWITRYRRKILVKGIKEYLKLIFKEATKHYPDWEFKEIGIADDHVHVHMVIPPKYSVSYVVETLKKNTSRRMREKFAFLKRMYRGDKGVWSADYFVSTVGKYVDSFEQMVAEFTGAKHAIATVNGTAALHMALLLAGVRQNTSMPVVITKVSETQLKVLGKTVVKMTDHGIIPPAPKIALGLIKVGNEVTVTFEWVLEKK